MPEFMKNLGVILSVVMGIAGALSATLAFLFSSSGVGGLISNATFSALFLLLFSWVVYREFKTARKYKFHSVAHDIHECIHNIRDTASYLEHVKSGVESVYTSERHKQVRHLFLSNIKYILDSLKATFEKISYGNIRTSIKMIYAKDGQLFVYTLCRDTESSRNMFESDKFRLKKNLDPVAENTDFSYLLIEKSEREKDRCYINNNIVPGEDYLNTSSLLSTKYQDNSGKCNIRIRYKSTIVWPIQQSEIPGFDSMPRNCIGFLSVDSDRSGAFVKATDFSIGASIADALYHLIRQFNELDETAVETGASENSA